MAKMGVGGEIVLGIRHDEGPFEIAINPRHRLLADENAVSVIGLLRRPSFHSAPVERLATGER